MLTPAERNYTIYEKECLAVLFGCEKCRSYLEHQQFELHCDNLALCWLLRRVEELCRLGRWVLRLAPFKFKVVHTKGTENVVADALSRVFEGQIQEGSDMICASLIDALPLVYSSMAEHQASDPFCVDLRQKLVSGQVGMDNFQIRKDLVCFHPKGAKIYGSNFW
jgi:hypothetical protein